MIVKCGHCGAENPSPADFCRSCGRSTGASPVIAPPSIERFDKLECLLAFVIGLAAMAWIQMNSPHMVGNDSYYHVRMAERLPAWGFIQKFPWLHWTIFRDDFVSHHYGFHILIAPFAIASQWITGDAVAGGKIATIFYSGVTCALLCEVLRRLGVRQRLFWVLLLGAAPYHYWLRMAYTRAEIVEMPMLLLAVMFCMGRRIWLIALLGFVSTHVYLGAVMYPLVALAFLPGDLLAGNRSFRALLPLAAAFAGLLAGIVISPYFPNNVAFLRTQIFETGLGAPDEVGVEWRSYGAWEFLLQAWPYGVVVVGALVLRLESGKPLNSNGFAMLFLNLGFLVLNIKARRFIEYWPVFALLNAADLSNVLRPRPKMARAVPLPESAAPNSAAAPVGYTRRDAEVNIRDRRAFQLIGNTIMAGILIFAAYFTLDVVRQTLQHKLHMPDLVAAMDWLKANSPEKSMVLTDDWDVFPQCFFYNQHNTYAVGLDPVFTNRIYPRLWDRYRIITRGESPSNLKPPPKKTASGPADPGDGNLRVTLDDIRTAFKADYVLVEKNHPDLYRQLSRASDKFEYVFPPARDAAPAAGTTQGAPRVTQPSIQPGISLFRVLPQPAPEKPRS